MGYLRVHKIKLSYDPMFKFNKHCFIKGIFTTNWGKIKSYFNIKGKNGERVIYHNFVLILTLN